MTLVDAVAISMFAGITLYAIFGGADFGSGVWDLTAGNAEKGGPLRRLIDHAIGPVWEANHVWLIFVLVFLWTGFPTAFAAMMRALGLPFWLAGLGIVLRGAGFAFRKFTRSLRWARVAGIVFAVSSLITPFFLGTIAGAVASGRVPVDERTGLWEPWLNPTSLLGGILAVLTATFLAGVFLAAKADQLQATDLADVVARRSLGVGLVVGAVAVLGIVPLAVDAETIFSGLTTAGAPLQVLSAVAGTTTLLALRNRRLRQARIAAVVAVGSVVVGWGVGQYPWALVDELSLDDAAASSPVLWGLTLATGLAALLVVPSLTALYVLADREPESA